MHNHNHLGVHLKAAHEYVPPYNTPRRILCTDTFCLNVTVARFRNFRPNTHQQRQKCARRVIWPRNRCVCNVMRLNMRSKRSWYFCLAAVGNKFKFLGLGWRRGGGRDAQSQSPRRPPESSARVRATIQHASAHLMH